MGYDVFISHSSKDKAVADAVCAALEANGIRCWIAPRDIKAGENWARAIMQGIASCRMMVLVFSANTNASDHIRREVERAVHRGIPIAPLRIQDAVPQDELEYFLSSSHWIDAMSPPLEKHLREFSRSVRALLDTAGGTAVPAPELAGADRPQSISIAPQARLANDTRADPAQFVTADKSEQRAPAPAARPGPHPRFWRVLATLLLISLVAAGWALRGEIARRLAPPPPVVNTPAADYTNTLGMKFVRIEPGEFDMGSRKGWTGHSTDESMHHVKLTKPLLMGIYHVTRGQFAVFARSGGEKLSDYWRNPGFDQTDDDPVVGVSWNDAVAFCQWLSTKEGRRYRLPTEAEWEYACRAGTRTSYYTGEGEAALAEAGWYEGNSDSRTHSVGLKKPNAWGLYDMHGDAWQWCSDYYGPYSAGVAIDPAGPTAGDANAPRVLRGGSWNGGPQGCQCAYRYKYSPGTLSNHIGFRLCLDF